MGCAASTSPTSTAAANGLEEDDHAIDCLLNAANVDHPCRLMALVEGRFRHHIWGIADVVYEGGDGSLVERGATHFTPDVKVNRMPLMNVINPPICMNGDGNKLAKLVHMWTVKTGGLVAPLYFEDLLFRSGVVTIMGGHRGRRLLYVGYALDGIHKHAKNVVILLSMMQMSVEVTTWFGKSLGYAQQQQPQIDPWTNVIQFKTQETKSASAKGWPVADLLYANGVAVGSPKDLAWPMNIVVRASPDDGSAGTVLPIISTADTFYVQGDLKGSTDYTFYTPSLAPFQALRAQ